MKAILVFEFDVPEEEGATRKAFDETIGLVKEKFGKLPPRKNVHAAIKQDAEIILAFFEKTEPK